MPKVKLSQTYIFGGKHYGPGEVDIASEDDAKALEKRDQELVEAQRRAGATEAQVNADGAVVMGAPRQEPAGPARQEPAPAAPEAPSVPRREAKDGGEAARRAREG
jgi:hypothetical protein